ncbi:2-dehydropantoate 2-reductase [Mycobacterium sp. MS1601]|uniref:ketopantoate reductase family protein n=1 Tax=Mycobacterium sp. MS1601 TaxID=1936029 RepID=UPI0009796144|nr:2-dehydropantoate 2-reductase [Mycobacterium sp. MS1601]AQA05862.1 2-dehydropantoate 2-reductase [Mycobacterium sp. MS1601]
MTPNDRSNHHRVVVYGAGAVGGVIAGRLQLAGVNVTAVARGSHLDAIRRDGLQLETQAGCETVTIATAADAGEICWTAETLVVLAVKSHQTAAALGDLATHAPPKTPILVAQNGVANEAAVLRRFPNVYGITVMLPSAHLEPGVVVQQSYPVAGILDLGCFPSGSDDTAEAASAMLRSAQFASQVREDIMAWKYRKLIANLANGVIATYGVSPDTDELMRRAREEAEQVLAAAGIAVVTADQDRERRGELLQGRARQDAYGSTWQSIARGRADVETDWLNGEIVLTARLHGLAAPVNELIQRVTTEHARSGHAPRSRDAAPDLAGLIG